MAPIKTNQSKVIPVAIVILGIIAGYFFYSSFIEKELTEIPLPVTIQDNSLSKFKDFNLDFSAFDDFRFKSLKVFGESPVRPGQTGRTDIFAPF